MFSLAVNVLQVENLCRSFVSSPELAQTFNSLRLSGAIVDRELSACHHQLS